MKEEIEKEEEALEKAKDKIDHDKIERTSFAICLADARQT